METSLLSFGRVGLPDEFTLSIAGGVVVENLCSLLGLFTARSVSITVGIPGVT